MKNTNDINNLKLPDVYHPERSDSLPADMIGATILRIGAAPRGWNIEGGGLVIEYAPHGQDMRRVVFSNTELGMWVDTVRSHVAAPAIDGARIELAGGRKICVAKDALDRGVSALVRGLGGGQTFGPWDHERMAAEIFAAMTEPR
jgi:hypothetical protein